MQYNHGEAQLEVDARNSRVRTSIVSDTAKVSSCKYNTRQDDLS